MRDEMGKRAMMRAGAGSGMAEEGVGAYTSDVGA